MTAFRENEEMWQRLDWSLLQNGPITLYYRTAILAEDIAWLRSHGYRIDELDCTRWSNQQDFHNDISRVLDFPDYYGKNLDALNDCMSDVEIPEHSGRVIVWHRFDAFAARERRAAQDIIDIMARNAWLHLLFGRRLLSLVQSDDSRLELNPVGAHPVSWNPREWLNASRGV